MGEEVEQFHSVNIAARQMAKYMHVHIIHVRIVYCLPTFYNCLFTKVLLKKYFEESHHDVVQQTIGWAGGPGTALVS